MGIMVRKIKRNHKRVTIKYVDRDDKVIKESFDFLIMAARMPFALNMLHKPTGKELGLFAEYNYRSVRYDVGYLESSGAIQVPFNLLDWIDRHDKQTDYHTANRKEDSTIERHVFARDLIDGAITMARFGKIKNLASDSTAIFSAAPFGTSIEEVRSLLAQDLGEYSMDMDFVHTEIWDDYSPWKNLTQVVQDRLPWRIWDNQGSMRTWYVGSYASFETVADVLDYNIKMINEKLCAPVPAPG